MTYKIKKLISYLPSDLTATKPGTLTEIQWHVHDVVHGVHDVEYFKALVHVRVAIVTDPAHLSPNKQVRVQLLHNQRVRRTVASHPMVPVQLVPACSVMFVSFSRQFRQHGACGFQPLFANLRYVIFI